MTKTKTYLVRLLDNGKILVRSNITGASKIINDLAGIQAFIEEDQESLGEL